MFHVGVALGSLKANTPSPRDHATWYIPKLAEGFIVCIAHSTHSPLGA